MAKSARRARPLLRKLVSNFASGEVSPELAMRVDSKAYQNGAARMRNVQLHASGAVSRRPGTTLIGQLDHATRLVAFDFDSDERYLICFYDSGLQIRGTDGTVLQTIGSMAWDSTEIFELNCAQKADLMVICHPALVTQALWRTGLTTFSIGDFAFSLDIASKKAVPFYKFADDAVTLAVSVTSGAGTATASSATFTSGHVGARLKWHDVQLSVTGYTSSTQVSVTVLGTLRGKLITNPYRTTNASAVVRVSHARHGFANGVTVTLSGSAAIGGLTAGNIDGARVITYVSEDEYDVTAGASATSSADGGGSLVYFSGANLPTRVWTEEAIGAVNGYPAACCFHEGRLVLGGTYGQPDGLWLSRTDTYFDFDVGDGSSTDSIQATIGSDRVAGIRHLISNRDLIVLSSVGEFTVPRGSQDRPLTPDTFRLMRQTQFGASTVRPALLDGSVFYGQSTGKAIREFVFDDSVQGYGSTNLSLLAEHLISSPVALAALPGTATRPEQYGYVVNSDGTMACFHSARSEGQAGWMLWSRTEDHVITDACALGPQLFLVSQLGGNKWYLERLGEDDGELSLDCSATASGPASTSWTWGSTYPYAGSTVEVVHADGWHLGSFTLSVGGVLTLPEALTGFTVGYDYPVEIRTMPIVPETASGPVIGQPMRIARVILGVHQTYDVAVEGQALVLRSVADEVSEAPPPAGADWGLRPPEGLAMRQEFRLLGWTRDGTIRITQGSPMPMRITGLLVEVLV